MALVRRGYSPGAGDHYAPVVSCAPVAGPALYRAGRPPFDRRGLLAPRLILRRDLRCDPASWVRRPSEGGAAVEAQTGTRRPSRCQAAHRGAGEHSPPAQTREEAP